MTAMPISLIVCTRNRGHRLPHFLASLASIEAPPGGWELVLVDNASTDATPDVLRRFAHEAPFPVQCVHAGEPGLSRARNVGLAHAKGDILAFTDDDCYPQADYLRALAAVFEEGEYGFVGGRTRLYDSTDARTTVQDADEAIDIEPRTLFFPGIIHGANMAVTREVVSAIGGFDPLLGAGAACVAAEDTDYIARAVWAGWRGRYDPRPVVAHHHGRKPGPDADRQRRGYDYGRGAFYMKRLLDARSRRTYLAGCYWEARYYVRTRNVGRFRRECSGAVRYAALRLLGSARRDRPAASPVLPRPRGATTGGARRTPAEHVPHA